MNNKPEQDWRERLYASKAAALLLYGRALGLNHNEAEDVLQEVFLAFLKLQTEPTEPEHYAVRSYRYRAFNYRRGLWRRLTRELDSYRWFERAPDESAMERLAMDCLARLPAEQRETIVLKIWHGHTFEEIGALLEVSPNTIAARYRYGLQKLRALLKGQDYERPEFAGKPDGLVETAGSLGPA